MDKIERKCGNCDHFKDTSMHSSVGAEPNSFGVCLLQYPANSFPVNGDLWCGEFSPKEKELIQNDLCLIIGKAQSLLCDMLVRGKINKSIYDELTSVLFPRKTNLKEAIKKLTDLMQNIKPDDLVKNAKTWKELQRERALDIKAQEKTNNEAEKVAPDEDKKPPIGLKPKFIHDNERFEEVKSAIERYLNNELTIPGEWLREYDDLRRKYSK